MNPSLRPPAVPPAPDAEQPTAERTACPVCDGDGEVYVGTSVPDCEPVETCECCNGSGFLPTPEEIIELRRDAICAAGDLKAAEWERKEVMGALLAERARLRTISDAASALAARLREIEAHPSYLGVFTSAMIHGCGYDGPNYGEQLEALDAALATEVPA
ncbi:MAG TPA: hypothetical protein VD962_09825 [Rubricoccaceae bacterium]|nr:hypothetical protein [Rubricoccaceae bacterium]